ncbi:ras GTPase-activating protein-binding protein 2-like [Pollicipes pollicipes]|uniref:ras GTPase-activating protein-binding protein 2-like n=1 Tax=Pollicipes pollicipes TaxID=41117 RepID=UPI0018854E48|nr:ras GTPase-activating protein-binding protein 2-like [Pollicipes pollicipes]
MVMGMPTAVMDEPTPRDISMVFVKQYYTLLNEAPDHVHRFYSQDSSFVHGGLERGKQSETKTARGQKEINDRIQKLQFKDARTKIKQVDAHPTLAGGVVIQVSGHLSNNGAPMRPFMQTFVLAPQTAHNYYVYNDIFRYQDDLFSDDEEAGDGAAEADDEAEPEPVSNEPKTYANLFKASSGRPAPPRPAEKIFVGNLPPDISDQELINHFNPFGEVVDVKIYSSKPPPKGVPPRTYPNYGFVIFDSAATVQKVLADMPVRLSRQGDEGHRLNIEKKQQQQRQIRRA